MEGDVFGQDYLQYTMLLVAFALDFLHQAGVVHTGNSPVFSPCFVLPADSDADISPNNILLGVSNPAEVFSTIESQEVSSPSPRKLLPDRTIYLSQAMPVTKGGPMVSDLGSAFLGAPGQKHSGDVMPNVFRAPEIILDMQWDSSIDVWGFGMTVRTPLDM